MFIAQAFNYKYDFWRYLLGSVLIFIATSLGQVPFGVAVFMKAAQDGDNMLEIDQTNMLGYLEPNLNLFLLLLSFAVGLIGLFIIIKTLHKQTIKSVTTSRKKIDWKRIWFAFFFWGIISSSLVLVDYYSNPEDYVNNFELNRFLILAVIAIIFVPIQTSLEEYIFRGYLMQGFGMGTVEKNFAIGFLASIIFIPILVYLNIIYKISIWYNLLAALSIIILCVFISELLKKRDSQLYLKLSKSLRRKWVPLLLTSLIFGLLHIANPEVEKLGYSIMVYYIGTGLFLGIITLMDEGMELALGFHAANNLFTALLVTADWTVFQTHSILKDVSDPKLEFIDLVLPVFIIFPILIFIFARVYKWDNWRDKLFGKIEEPPKEDYKIIGSDYPPLQ